MALTVQITGDALKALNEGVKQFGREKVHQVVALYVAKLIQKHLLKMETGRPNKQGWPRSHFWSKARGSVVQESSPTGAMVSVAQQGFRFQYAGGTIKPINVKALTIPLIAKAYNRRARELDLRFIKPESYKGNVVGYLVSKDPEPQYYFVLKSRISKGPDRSVLPTDAQILEAASEGIRDKMEAAGL